MVLGCTLFAAAAQVMMKFGATHAMPALDPRRSETWLPLLLAIAGNVPLVAGYALNAGNAVLLIMALRDGELSMLYPIIALTYVWVNILSVYLFHDTMNVWKVLGISLIIGGVALLGKASQSA